MDEYMRTVKVLRVTEYDRGHQSRYASYYGNDEVFLCQFVERAKIEGVRVMFRDATAMSKRPVRACVKRTYEAMAHCSRQLSYVEDRDYESEHARLMARDGFVAIADRPVSMVDCKWWRTQLKIADTVIGDSYRTGRRTVIVKDFKKAPKEWLDQVFSDTVKAALMEYFDHSKVHVQHVEFIAVPPRAPAQEIHRDHILGPNVLVTLAIAVGTSKLLTRFIPGSHMGSEGGKCVAPHCQALLFDGAVQHGGGEWASDEPDTKRLFISVSDARYKALVRDHYMEGHGHPPLEVLMHLK
jgi:hypothetical protein